MRLSWIIGIVVVLLAALSPPKAHVADDWEAQLATMSHDDPALATE